MKIKKSSLDTLLILFLMFVTILPLFIAKQLVILSSSFLLLRIITSRDIFFYSKKKIIIFILLMPGILGAFFSAPEHLVRFFGILLIVLGFPFSSFKIKHFPIVVLSSLILLYLIITQILIMQENQIILNFRDFAYYYENVEVHRDTRTTDNIFKNLFDFSYWKARGGGLYSNPNTLSGVVIIYFFIFDVSWKYFNQSINYGKKKWNKYFYQSIFLLVLFCLMQTKSKTYLIAFLVYLIFQHFDVINLLRLRIKKKLIVPLFFGVGILSLFFGKVIDGIFLEGGSAFIKYSILFNYLENASVFNLIFGGIFFNFDAEFSLWIGAVGLIGVIAFFNFYRMVYQYLPQSKALLISLLMISLGGSLFYSLLLVSILIPLFVILLSSSKRPNE
ncbi:hypothetical protein N9J78_04060 [Candidatus Pelagibacter sp.]|nr:hypothetical protein [Candidatus Pelagibacter sp.]